MAEEEQGQDQKIIKPSKGPFWYIGESILDGVRNAYQAIDGVLQSDSKSENPVVPLAETEEPQDPHSMDIEKGLSSGKKGEWSKKFNSMDQQQPEGPAPEVAPTSEEPVPQSPNQDPIFK